MARKLQKQDVQYIEKIRTALNEDSELSTNIPEDNSIFDQICLDQFHTQILKLSPIIALKIESTETIAKSKESKEHTLYLISISTNEINYKVKRRYSEFYDLYKKIKKFLPTSSSFPKKNYNPFVSSTSQAIIQQRCRKLNQFMQSVLNVAMSSKQGLVSLCFCNFIELKENYKNHLSFMNQYSTSFQQKLIYNKGNKFNALNLSHLGFNNLNENSIEMLIIRLNEKLNTGKYLEKLGQHIKNKKQKATHDEIMLIFMGFEKYQGLLYFGINSCLESNRVIALQMLLDLIIPQNNFHFQKFQKIVEKIPIDLWIVKNIAYLQNSTFKILYFRLLRIYSQRMEKEMHFDQAKILKKLFLFHQDLITDYLQFKKLNNGHYYTSLFNEHSQFMSKIEQSQQIEVLDFQQKQSNHQLIHYVHNSVDIYCANPKNILVLKLQSNKTVDEIIKISYKWNRTVEAYSIEQYTGLYRYKLAYQDKFWSLRMKIEVQSIKIDELKLIPVEVYKQFSNSSDYSFLKIYKRQQPFEICPQYEEQILIKQKQHTCQILLALKVARDIDIFEGSLQKLASVLAEDASNIF